MAKPWLPPEIIRQQILKPGGAFRMFYQFPNDDSPKNRYFFVLNHSPENDTIILLSTTTTKIDKRKAVRPPEVLVEITPEDYAELKEYSLVDCSGVIDISINEFMEKLSNKEVTPLFPLPDIILSKIKQAIANSKTIKSWMKSIIIKEDG